MNELRRKLSGRDRLVISAIFKIFKEQIAVRENHDQQDAIGRTWCGKISLA
jgi:hypothetical protein